MKRGGPKMKNNNVMMNVYRCFLITAAHIVRIIASACFILAFIAEVTAENALFLKAYGKEVVLYLVTYGKEARAFLVRYSRIAREKGTETINHFLVWFGSAAAFRNEIIAQDKYYEGI